MEKLYAKLGGTFALALAGFFVVSSATFAQKFEETTNTKTDDDQFKGGYDASELQSMSAEQQKIYRKFMKGRYSSATGKDSRYGGLLEKHDNNLDGITDHDNAVNAAESAGDLVGLGKKGLNGNERRRAMIEERIKSSGNCELTKEDRENLRNNNFSSVKGILKGNPITETQILDSILGPSWKNYLKIDPATNAVAVLDPTHGEAPSKAAERMDKLNLYQRQRSKRFVAQKDSSNNLTGKFNMICPNISAVVLDKGLAHDASIGIDHRVYALNEKMFKAGSGPDGPFGGNVSGEAVNVGKQYASKVVEDSANAEEDPNTQYSANYDDLRSEFVWLEHQKKHRLRETWKTLRAERFIAGDEYDPAQISQEIGSLLSQNADKSDAEKDALVAERIAEQNVYSVEQVFVRVSGAANNIRLDPPIHKIPSGSQPANLGAFYSGKAFTEICPIGAKPCFLSVNSKDLREPIFAQHIQGVPAEQLPRMAIEAAKQAAGTSTGAADHAKNKARLAERIKECMARDKWCEQVELKVYKDSLNPDGSNTSEIMTAINNNPKLKGRGITIEDVKAGTAYLETKGDPGNAFKDTREFISATMDRALEGPLADFMNTMAGANADFSAAVDAKSGTNNFAVVKAQWEQNMKMAKAVREQSEKSYQECLAAKGDNCKRQYDESNYDVNSMNFLQIFGRDIARDGNTTNTAPFRPGSESGSGSGGRLSNPSTGLEPRQPKNNGPLPDRGSAPMSAPSPFSLN